MPFPRPSLAVLASLLAVAALLAFPPATLDAAVKVTTSSAPTGPPPQIRGVIKLKGKGDRMKLMMVTSVFGEDDPEVTASVRPLGDDEGTEVPLALTKRKTSRHWGGDVLTLRLDGSRLEADEYVLEVELVNPATGATGVGTLPVEITRRGHVRVHPGAHSAMQGHIRFTGEARGGRHPGGIRGNAGGDVYPGSATPYTDNSDG